MINTPQDLAFAHWQAALPALTRHRKLRDYGTGETAPTLWEKLPVDSKQHWEWQARGRS